MFRQIAAKTFASGKRSSAVPAAPIDPRVEASRASRPDEDPQRPRLLLAAEAEEAAADTSTADPLRLYVRQIGNGRILTREEERDLARRKDEGDPAARRQLIEANLRLVMSITRN